MIYFGRFALGSFGIFCVSIGAAAAPPEGPPQPFERFLVSVEKAAWEDYVPTKDRPALTRDRFDEMKAYIAGLYHGVKVERTYRSGEQVFDCVVIGTQPSAQGQRSIAAPPETAAPVHDHKMGSCPQGTVPLRRVTLELLIRFRSTRAFTQKSEGERLPR